MYFFIFTLCQLGEIIVAPPLKIFLPPLTFSPKSGHGIYTYFLSSFMFFYGCVRNFKGGELSGTQPDIYYYLARYLIVYVISAPLSFFEHL